MLSVSYLYDLPLPSPRAATIQILNTCRALVDLGAPATVYAGPAHRHECARFYGIDPHEAFRLVALFSRIPGRPELRWRLRRILATRPARHGTW